MHILEPHPIASESETLGPSLHVVMSSPGGSEARLMLENHRPTTPCITHVKGLYRRPDHQAHPILFLFFFKRKASSPVHITIK